MIRSLARLSLLFAIAACSSWTSAQNAATPRPDPIAILNAAKAASGGAAWNALRTQHSNVSISTAGVKGTAERWSDIYSGRSLIKYSVGPVSGAAGYDGKVAWSQDAAGQSRTESAAVARELAVNAAYRDKLAFWFPDRAPAQISFMDRVVDDGAAFDVIRVLPEGGRPFQFWVNADTHLIERLVEREAQDTRTEYFMDLRDVEGVKVPFRVRATRGDARYDEVITVDKLDYNWALSGVNFVQPGAGRPDFTLAGGRAAIDVPFEVRDGHMFITVALNGKGPFRMLLDADRGNVLSPRAMAALGVQPQGNFGTAGAGEDQQEVGVARIEHFDAGGVGVDGMLFAAIDVTAFMSRVEGIDDVSGIVGFELFKRFPIKLDYQRARATFYDPSRFTYSGGGVDVPVKLREHTPVVEGSLDGFKGAFAIDTSSRGSVSLTAPFVDRNGLVKRYGATQSFVSGVSAEGYSHSLLARGYREARCRAGDAGWHVHRSRKRRGQCRVRDPAPVQHHVRLAERDTLFREEREFRPARHVRSFRHVDRTQRHRLRGHRRRQGRSRGQGGPQSRQRHRRRRRQALDGTSARGFPAGPEGRAGHQIEVETRQRPGARGHAARSHLTPHLTTPETQTKERRIMTKTKGGGIHFPAPKGKHGAPLVPGQDARKPKAQPVPRVVPRTKASPKGR